MPRAPAPRALGRALTLACALVSPSFLGASCGQSALGILPGVINDPKNVSLRKSILEYGTGRLCADLMKRSVPMRARVEDPIAGRVFPTGCAARDLANRDLFVQVGGRGYLWNNLAQRVGFTLGGYLAYDTDFQLDGSTMYVYFRQRVANVEARTTLVEQPQAAFFGGLPAAPGGKSLNDTMANQLMQAELARGFTVIRDSSGYIEVGPGMVPPGKHPIAPFKGSDGREVVVNDRSELHASQRDFVGPFEVPQGKKLVLSVGIDGAPAADVLLVPRALGEAWLQSYLTQAQTTPPPGQPFVDEPVFSGAVWRKTLPVPAGQYYLVLDNTATAGRTNPTAYAHDDRAVLASYAIELE